MKENSFRQRSIQLNPERDGVLVLDQRYLPEKKIEYLIDTSGKAIRAIRDMVIRGAPLIGVTAAYGIWLAARELADADNFQEKMKEAARSLQETRPTAINLAWSLNRQMSIVEKGGAVKETVDHLLHEAERIATEDALMCWKIGNHGLRLIEEIADKKGRVNLLTHCNAGRLACVEYGTATAPIYLAHEKGIDVHVWVDETRPRLQGARLTAYELGEAGIPHTIIPDNAAGHIMQHGMVDIVIVGCDRLTRFGDACNKIGTYTKALAARDNNLPFYVALPSSTIDWGIEDWKEIPIEQRPDTEVNSINGFYNGEHISMQITPDKSPVANYGFDVTPARLITGIITEEGIKNTERHAKTQRKQDAKKRL